MRPLTYCAFANGHEALDHSRTTGLPLNSASVRFRFAESMTSNPGAARPTAASGFVGAVARARPGRAAAHAAVARRPRLFITVSLLQREPMFRNKDWRQQVASRLRA